MCIPARKTEEKKTFSHQPLGTSSPLLGLVFSGSSSSELEQSKEDDND